MPQNKQLLSILDSETSTASKKLQEQRRGEHDHHPPPPPPNTSRKTVSPVKLLKCEMWNRQGYKRVHQKILFKIWDQYLLNSDIKEKEKGIF